MLPNCRSQFLLDRRGRCFKLFVSTESTSCHEFACQFALEFFLYAKNTQSLGETSRKCQCLFQWPATSHCRQGTRASRLGATDPSNSDNLNNGDGGVCVGVCTHSCGCLRTCVFVRACVRACVRAVFAIYDNNI